MKNIFTIALYASFLLLAVRADAADTERLLRDANTALAQYRASGSITFLDQAQTAVKAALKQSPDHYIAQRSEVAVLLARRADSTALTRATALNARFPDDVDTYALMIDAELALGLYRDAERDTQRLLDLRPDNVPGLIRAARLRELYGDWQGAIDFINATLNRVTEDDREQRAALYTQLARLHFGAGHDDVAGEALTAAFDALPDYLPALQAGVRMARLRGTEQQALHRAQDLYRVMPGVNELLVLARARAAAGEGAQAAPLLREFVSRAHAIAAQDDNANLALSSYYAYEGHDPARAVSFAASARAQRADVETLLAYATALHRAGRDIEANKVVATLARLGYRDVEFLALADAMHATLATAADSTTHLR